MAEAGYTFAKTGPAPSDRVGMTLDQQKEIGYEKSADTEWDDLVARQPGQTWGQRLRAAIQLTLEPYEYDRDKAIKELRDSGKMGLVRFAADGTPIGGKALAGALRAAEKHPNMHRMMTADEMAEEYAATGGMKRARRTLTPVEKAYRAEQEARRARAREELERTGGGTDLRRRRTAGKQRSEDLKSRGVARRESFRRASREAAEARKRASAAAVTAGS